MPRQTQKYRGGSGKKWSRHAGGAAGKQVVSFFEGPLANDQQKNILKQLYESRSSMNSVPDVAVTSRSLPHSSMIRPAPLLSKLNLYQNTPGEHIATAAQHVQKAAQKTATDITMQASNIANTATNRVQDKISNLTNAVTDVAKKLANSVRNLGTTTNTTLKQAARTTGLEPKVEAFRLAASQGDTIKMQKAATTADVATSNTMTLANSPAFTARIASGGKRKRQRRKFKRGTKSKTHSGKNFETRKTSKKYTRKSFKKRFGRKTVASPLFPFVGGRKRRGGNLTRKR
jgi:hypothetical protein